MNGLQLPNWIVPAAGLAAAVWAIAMWWMVATLPTAGASDAKLDLIVARAEIDRLEISVDELSQQVSAFRQERSELALRLEALESNSLVAAIRTAQTAPVAGPPVATATPIAPPTPNSEPAAAPTAEPTPAPTTAPEPVIEATPQPTAAASTRYLTSGRDRYNCKDFDSWEEAQAAYEANLPGDPNKIDINNNGIACEALR